jgi:hypothetical protein
MTVNDDTDEDVTDDEDADFIGHANLEDDVDSEGCCLGSACLNPHPYHLAYECFNIEMAVAFEAEGNTAT